MKKLALIVFILLSFQAGAQQGTFKVLKNSSMEWSPKQQQWIHYPWKLVDYNIVLTPHAFTVKGQHFKLIRLKNETNNDEKKEMVLYALDQNDTDCLLHIIVMKNAPQFLCFTMEYEDIKANMWITGE